MSQASQEPRFGYTLVVGPEDADRQAILSSLHAIGLELAAGTEAEILAAQDWVPPTLVVLNDSGTREERLATQKRLARHPPLMGVPLLIVSPAADIDSFTGSITHGAAAYLVKPVPPGELETVARRLSGWKGVSDRTERRRRVRRPLIMRVTVDIRARKRKVPGQVVDASGGGCRLELHEELQVNEPIRIILHGHEQTTHVALGAEVRWDLRDAAGTHLAGVRFTGTTAMLAGKLLGFASSGMT
jgi:response regulator RpfG family c-di-GMP phosphodiesterase